MTVERTGLPSELRTALLARDGHACRTCGVQSADGSLLEFAHVVAVGDGGADSPENLITLCPSCHAETDYNSYLSNSIGVARHSFDQFVASVDTLRRLSVTELQDVALEVAFTQMLFVSAIAALETYLGDTLIGTVMSHGGFVQHLVESTPEFKAQRINLSDIYRKYQTLRTDVRDYLLQITYHNLPKVRELYRAVLDVSFPDDFAEVARAIKQRHDLVHRGGKNRDGNVMSLERHHVLSLIENVQQFITHIDVQVRQRRWLQGLF